MTVFAPYDGSALSTAALERAAELATALDESLVAATVVPDDRRRAVDEGWIDADEPLDPERVEARLREQVAAVAPSADYVVEHADRGVPSGGIARRLRDIAHRADASVVVVGSENVGRSGRPADTVAGRVAARLDTDLYLVQATDG